jgi:hypothetical protein
MYHFEDPVKVQDYPPLRAEGEAGAACAPARPKACGRPILSVMRSAGSSSKEPKPVSMGIGVLLLFSIIACSSLLAIELGVGGKSLFLARV